MDSRYFDEVVSKYVGTDIERDARAYYEGSWDELDSFQKFTWLAFAERRSKRDI